MTVARMNRNLMWLVVLIGGAGCSQSQLPSPQSNQAESSGAESTPKDVADASSVDDLPVKLVSQHLPNPVRLHRKVISGGLPEGDAAFQELADLGIKTVISVDGMTPDVAMAKRHGLSYVHLPHGYDGIPSQRIKELAKAVHGLPGPIYIHCHHGKHRSPAAASVACVSAGLIPPDMAVSVLELAGTNPGYRGLFQAAQEAAPFEQALLNELHVEFQEVQKIPPMAEAMVHLSHAADHLKLIAEAGWKSPANHPDLEPAHEALLLRELFTEMLRTDEVKQQPDDFQQWLRDSETAAQELEMQLNTWKDARQSSPSPAAPPEELATQMERILADCKACHVSYRDVPLSEKP